jgi:threonine dehydratase
MITIADIRRARARTQQHVLHTPLQNSPLLSARLGFDLFLKMENRQYTGSFKPRGAMNKILALTPEARARGIVAASAGNHALGVAHAARALRLKTVDIYVQANAAPAKIAKLRRYDVMVHLTGQTFEEAQQAALVHVQRTGASWVSAYDDVEVIAGQGTCGLEILQDLPDVDTIVVPVGGGGLIAGIAIAAKSIRPSVRIIGVNPTASPSAYLSLRDGRHYDPYDHEPTLAHGLAGGFGRVPFEVAMPLLEEIVLVTDEEIMRAMVALIDAEQVLTEASGAAGAAAALSGRVGKAQKCAVVLSGGNIDAQTLSGILAQVLRVPEKDS